MRIDYPSDFLDQIRLRTVIALLAHGTDIWREINGLYLSAQERTYAERQVETHVFALLKTGRVRATGFYSATATKREAKNWERKQYKQYSNKREYVPKIFWRNFIAVTHEKFRGPKGEYKDVYFVVDDIKEHLGGAIGDRIKWFGSKSAPPQNQNTDIESAEHYITPYIELMFEAIDHFNIAIENQPLKKNIVEWFLDKTIAGQPVSKHRRLYT